MFADKGDRRSKFSKFKPKKLTQPESELEFKNIVYLETLVGPTGKILSRRRTGFDGQNQRKLANAIKVARFMGLMAYSGAAAPDPRDERPERGPRRPREPREDDNSSSEN